MKNILLAIVLLCTISAHAQIKSAQLTASGLTCSMCSKSIFKALEKVPAIQSVEADVEKSIFTIVFKPGVTISPDEVKKAVEDAGFSVASMVLTTSFAGSRVGKDSHISIGGNTYHVVGATDTELNGDVSLRVVDKNFTSPKEHKKYGKATAMKCYESGMRGTCCPADASSPNRIYHVVL